MMPMFHRNVAGDAKIVVIANIASDKVAIWEDCRKVHQHLPQDVETLKLTFNAGIAGPRPLFLGVFCLDIVTRLNFHTPRSNLLSSAVDDFSVAHDSLDQPMILTSAVGSLIHTLLAEVEITAIAITAMKVMCI
jgi:hypothetical protein